MRNKRGKGKITITIRQENEGIVLSVKDTGMGIDKEKLHQLNQSLETMGDEHKKGYGLYNVNERIKLTHGAPFGIRVESEYQVGTEIIVLLPVII
ncbi:sensor histidine kinase [Neobacillus sp. Marseille-QA0830]